MLSFRFGKDAKVVHFLGAIKPWHHFCDPETSQVQVQQHGVSDLGVQSFIQLWWDVYKNSVALQDAEASKSQVSVYYLVPFFAEGDTGRVPGMNNLPVLTDYT